MFIKFVDGKIFIIRLLIKSSHIGKKKREKLLIHLMNIYKRCSLMK